MLLQGQARPFTTYYHSGIDSYHWRSAHLEMLNPRFAPFLIPGQREIGQFPKFTWGSLFPRSGFIHQPNTTKAAAVIASRAANIATSNWGLRLYLNLATQPCRNRRCTTGGEILESNNKSLWQRLLPQRETRCTQKITDTSNPDWTNENYQNNENDKGYAWLVWRYYKGCLGRSRWFLYDIEF